ncbi:RimJ/RimL family protein N-acetyltransferase [Peribacillus deserti]|uniref:RimJ/RimL family protein N-acetyltransferase n=1 Tax=Peribacillus deserti TaxID=673318 RepID=A0ABS2QMM3_9BACI|nr:GNAT family protein [Peribacillus deserti]MBM7694210.1 RimJ/RimL family protein N-acetyltransferase [Peribacillus deserti]
MEPIRLKGKRAELIPLEPVHINDLFSAAASPEIWTFMSVDMKDKDVMESVVETALHQQKLGAEMPFTVIDTDTGRAVGSTRYLNISEPNKTLEIGWTWYNPSVWRTRINTECKYLLLSHAFEQLGMNRVQFKTDLRNIRSQNAIARLGAKKEGVLRNDRIMYDGYIRSSVVFSILKQEWPDVKLRLEAFLEQSV